MSKYQFELNVNIDIQNLYSDMLKFVSEQDNCELEMEPNLCLSLKINGNHNVWDLRKYIKMNNKNIIKSK